MDQNIKPHITFVNIVLAALAAIALIGYVGLRVKGSHTTSTAAKTIPTVANSASSSVGSLVTYTLPNGWTQLTCASSGSGDVQYIVSGGTSSECDNSGVPTIKIAVDNQSITDCSQLQNVQNVSKHTCKSLFIDGHKTLQSLTQYNQSASALKDTSVASYFLNTGKGVVSIEYTYKSDATLQPNVDQLVNSIKVKN
jgi:uncharacterized protein YqkB